MGQQRLDPAPFAYPCRDQGGTGEQPQPFPGHYQSGHICQPSSLAACRAVPALPPLGRSAARPRPRFNRSPEEPRGGVRLRCGPPPLQEGGRGKRRRRCEERSRGRNFSAR